MYPKEKRLIALVSVAILGLALYFISTFLYILFIIGVACAALFCQTNGLSQQSRLGHHPRPHLIIPPAIRRWFPGKPANGVSSPGKASNRGTRGRFFGDSWQSVVYSGDRRWERRKEAERDESSGSLLFSPRDLLMGSYLAKPESPSAAGAHGRPIGGTRELRERLARPNHIVQSPNKRLSFGESMNASHRFNVTPQRCYPIQQTGYSSVGVLPSVQWDGYCKKNVLSSRNSSMVHSPVTVKIARPDSGSVRSPLFEHLPSPVASLSPVAAAGSADPCSKETVLSALRESRKRVADEEEERCYSAGQDKKRRRHDSSGSAHSAFEPLLANGAPSLLVPKPGTLKRSANSLAVEDPLMKRSRTSSISSLNCTAPSGVPGSVRNSIHSSYSSTRGISQLRKISALNMSPLSSPGSSRSQTPERSPKKPREENSYHSSTSTPVKSDRTPEQLAKKLSPLLNQTAASSSCSTPPSAGAHGKRKRKIPLVSSRRADQITLPPPPELGYTITASDLDSEKKAALNRIKKVLEEIEPSKSTPSSQSVASFTQTTTSSLGPTPSAIASLLLSSSTATALSSTVTGITSPSASSSSAATAHTGTLLNSVIASASATAATTSAGTVTTLPSALPAGSQPSPNPLLDSLRKMQNTPATTTTAAAAAAPPATTTDSAKTLLLSLLSTSAAPGSTLTSIATVKPQPSTCFPSALAPQPAPPSSQPASSILSSVFSQVLPESSSAAAGGMTFGLSSMGHSTAPSSSSTCTTTTAAASSSTQAFSAFKPVFGDPAASQPAPVSAPASSSAAPIFKSVFGTASTGSAFGQPSAKASAAGSSSVFGGLSTTTAPPPTAELPAKPNFSFGANPASTVTTGSSNTTTSAGATQSFQFGAATTMLNSTAGFQFGKQPAAASSTAAPAVTAPAPQVTFAFGQTLNNQTAASGAFGGFGTAAPAPATTAAPANKATFSFGNAAPVTFSAATSSAGTAAPFGGMGATTNPTLFGSTSTVPAAQPAAVAPFPFGGSATATTFSFGGQTTTAASTFGTPSMPAFGNTSTGFSFGTNTSSSATPAFGSCTQTTSANAAAPSAFGSTLPVATAGFSFGAAAQSSSAASAFPAPSARQSTAPKPSTTGFNFGNTFAAPAPAATSSMESKPAFGGFNFGTPNLNFGAGSASPAFGQSTPGGPIPFGSPATPAPNYTGITPSPFGSPTPSFSIGAGSKPSGRQRLMARRQHTRKK
ncbi:nuclear envelope pore membrane protein POM 121-like isoform X2 [Acipenser ruthenus]|uniref:nuclear envelope pore membrane protein POM 121-like isoform X2 n=1 Tax=Acipenser ruthenus TaxID=7906 RepID=UPI0027427B89|nr:nuclear envelope pore membrane protein POM 121-like isoform X2 [Acipenser ruthenus]